MKKLAWVHYHIDPKSGHARGYMTMAFNLWSALRNLLGGDLIEAPLSGAHPKIHLHVVPPHYFMPVPGKTNVLFTMWETDTLPDHVIAGLAKADRLLVPSDYCRQVWKAHGFNAEVVPLGVHDAWLTADTHRSTIAHEDRVLRYLWVGSAISRKGWELLAPAWKIAFGGTLKGGVQLYVKTIAAPGMPRKVEETFAGRVIVDSRDLDMVDLLHLYESADVFVFPSYGEGFGLPPLEAMAAGCLVLAPRIGGLCEFINPVSALVIARSRAVTVDYGGPAYDTLVPSVEDVARAMRLAHDMWGTPKVEDRRAYGISLARRSTWTVSAERLIAALNLKRPAGSGPDPEPVAPPSGTEGLGQRALDAPASCVVSSVGEP